MLHQATAPLTLNHTLPLNVPATVGVPLEQAAAAAGISPRTLRSWCADLGMPLAYRDGRGWQIADTALLAEMVARRSEPAVDRASVPGPRVARESTLSVDEAAALLGTSRVTVWRYCEAIPRFAVQQPGVHARWRVDGAVAAIVGAIRGAAGGTIPIGALVKETERRTEFFRLQLTLMRHPEAMVDVKTRVRQRIMKASTKPKRPSPPDDAAPP